MDWCRCGQRPASPVLCAALQQQSLPVRGPGLARESRGYWRAQTRLDQQGCWCHVAQQRLPLPVIPPQEELQVDCCADALDGGQQHDCGTLLVLPEGLLNAGWQRGRALPQRLHHRRPLRKRTSCRLIAEGASQPGTVHAAPLTASDHPAPAQGRLVQNAQPIVLPIGR